MDKKIRILFSTGVFPPIIGGPGKIVEALGFELSKYEYDVSVLTMGKKNEKQYPFSVTRISFSIPQPLRFFVILIKTIQITIKNDIIYATDNYSNGFSAAIVSKILRKPLIVRFTGDSVWESEFNKGKINSYITDFQNQKHSILVNAKIWRRNFILKSAKKIITDCEFLKNLVCTFGIDPDKITVINNAAEQIDNVDFKKEKNIILTMGRLVPWKGIKIIINAMSEIRKQIKDAELYIAGDGPEMNNLKETAKFAGAENKIHFLGNISDKNEKKKLYAMSKVFVLNTFYEGMSNVITEAMCYGLPIVTTRSGGNPEFVNEENGILVDYNNQKQITDAIIKLLSDASESEQLGMNGKQKSEKYTFEALAIKNMEIIKEIVLE